MATLFVMTPEFYQCPVNQPYNDTQVLSRPFNEHDDQVSSTPNQLPLQMTPRFPVPQNQGKFSRILVLKVGISTLYLSYFSVRRD